MGRRGPKSCRDIAKTAGGLICMADEYVASCLARDIPPTSNGFELLHGQISAYGARPQNRDDWLAAIQYTREKISQGKIEFAFTHPEYQRLSNMMLGHIKDFAPVKQEVEVNQSTTINLADVRAIAEAIERGDVDEG